MLLAVTIRLGFPRVASTNESASEEEGDRTMTRGHLVGGGSRTTRGRRPPERRIAADPGSQNFPIAILQGTKTVLGTGGPTTFVQSGRRTRPGIIIVIIIIPRIATITIHIIVGTNGFVRTIHHTIPDATSIIAGGATERTWNTRIAAIETRE